MVVKNPAYNQRNSNEHNEILVDYFDKIESSFSTIDLNVEPGAVSSQIQQVFVSVPTNINIDVVVKDKTIEEVHEGDVHYLVDNDNNKYKDCIKRFNEIISPSNTMGDLYPPKRSLLLRPYWKNGIIKNFISLKPIDIISTNQYSIVLGGPGTGKSTLLKHLSVLLAKQYYASTNLLKDDAYSEFFFKNKYIPIFVQLRWLFNDQLIRTDPMRYITKKSLLEFLFDDKWSDFLSILMEKNVIIFFDGIDEILVGNNVCQIVQKLVDVSKEINHNTKIVFSSRKESYSTWQLDGFTSFELCPMDKACQQLLASKVLRTYHFCDFDTRFKTLIEQLESCGLDEQIVGNPLFLSLMVVIYAVNGKLPDQKSVMLKESIRFLIKRWQIKISQENFTNTYELEQLYSALKEIAYATINNGSKDSNPLIIQREKIITALDDLVSKNALASFIPNENIGEKREMLLKCLVDSVGVIVPSRSSEQFEFSHRHFQEYLVASKLVEMPNLPKLLMNMIISQSGIHQEIYFMVMEIIFDKEDYITLWNLLQFFALSDDCQTDGKNSLNAWITWFCCKVISIRDYSLLKTASEYNFLTENILKKINARANALISTTHELSMQMRVECARYLGEISEKIVLRNKGIGEKFASSLSLDLGDKRVGVNLNADHLPDIVWCRFESGEFTMGLTDEEANVILHDNPGADFSREQPCVTLKINEFEISKYPITVAQYMAFVDAGAYSKSNFWEWSEVSAKWFEEVGSKKQFKKPNVLNAPIVDIAWIEAAGFCFWLSKRTNTRIRMPFECEWEYVAKFNHCTYCYSDDFDTEKYVSKKLELNKAAPVGVYVCDIKNYPSDLTGNIWEWTQTLIPQDCESLKDYKKSLSKRNVIIPTNAINRDSRMVARGGSFLNLAFQSRNSYRGRDYIWNHITSRQGFRIVKELRNE